VRDWLVTEGWSEPVADLPSLLDPVGSPWGPGGRWVLANGPDATMLKARLYGVRPLHADQPLPPVVEGGPVSYVGPTGVEHSGVWRRVHTMDDGLVDWSAFCFIPSYRVALAATQLEVDQAEWRTLLLASTGPVLLYVNGECVLCARAVSYMEPVEHEVRVWLPSGVSTIVACCWQVGFRECRQVLRLRLTGLPVRVVLPSPGADERISAIAEQVLDAVGVPRWGLHEPALELIGPRGAALRVRCGTVEHRVRLDGGHAAVRLDAGLDELDPATAAGPASSASMLATGELTVRVCLDHDASPLFREFGVAVLPQHYRDEPVGDPSAWRSELLRHAAQGPNGCAAELAAAALHAAHTIRPDRLDGVLWMITNRADCADFEILGLLHLWHRVPEPSWPPAVRAAVREALLGMKYWIDQPGLDAMCYFTENHQLVWHTAEYLTGIAFQEETFSNTGWTGAGHAKHGADLARAWLRAKLAGGFSEFDSNAYLAIDVFALVTLVEFAPDQAMVELAAGLLDKTLFTLAANSWRGAHVCAHGRSYVSPQRSSRFEETAPIMWLCWGVGALNHATLPATSLATARRYALPAAVRDAGRPWPGEWTGRQHYRGDYRLAHDLLSRPYSSDLVVFRIPDAMLSCVQDYRSGLPGLQEHIWTAALGPETQVYVTHPPNEATHPSARPNAWAGNRILPRARQHADTVLALYRIPADDPMGHTHAWFPLSTMDEWAAVGPWLAGRYGRGYVALATAGGCRVLRRGATAFQEVRAAAGPGTAWVCVVGSQATDGDFGQFSAALGVPDFGDDEVSYRTRHGVTLALDWDGPFTVDGHPADLTPDGRPAEPLHLDNPLIRLPFGAPEMVIGEGPDRHVIDLQWGRPVD
jgi:hypothetical protein